MLRIHYNALGRPPPVHVEALVAVEAGEVLHHVLTASPHHNHDLGVGWSDFKK